MKYIIPPCCRNTFLYRRLLPTIIGLFFITLIVSTTNAIAQQNAVVWETDINRATTIAKETGRPLFMHFYGNNCPPCKAMDSSVFTDPRVAAELGKNFVAVKIDTTKNPDLAKRFEIAAIPTDILLDENGRIANRRQGGITADRFCQYLAYLQTNVIKQQAQLANSTPAPQPSVAIKPIASQVNETVLLDPFTKQPAIVSTPTATPIAQPAIAAIPTQVPSPDPIPNHAPAPKTAFVPQPIPQSAPTFVGEPTTTTQSLKSNDSVFAVAASSFDSPSQALQSTTPVQQIPERSNPVRTEWSVNTQKSTTAPVLPSDDCLTTSTQTVEVPLGLEGYCPVILGNEERWTPGNPALYVMFRGHVYRFSSDQAMAAFIQNPMKYAPIAMGEDIVLMVERNKKSYGTRKFGAWYDGRVYLFSCQESLNVFAAKPEYYAEIAQKYETAFISPMNTVQR